MAKRHSTKPLCASQRRAIMLQPPNRKGTMQGACLPAPCSIRIVCYVMEARFMEGVGAEHIFMQMIQPLQADAGRLPKPVVSVDERIVESKVRARRRQVFRTIILLGLSAAMLCGFVIWRRDSLLVKSALENAEKEPVSALQAKIDALGLLPASIPETHRGSLQSYAGDADRFYAMNADEPVIVGVSSPVTLILRPNGRYVIIYDKGKVHAEWLSLRDYDKAVEAQMARMKLFEDKRQARPPVLP